MDNRVTILEKRVDAQAELISRMMVQIRDQKRAGEKHEGYYQKLLEQEMSAGPLSIPGVGRTDVTTPTQHIEIKRWGRYHEVAGQLAKYQRAAPRPQLAVYFFGGKPGQTRLQQIEALMQSHNIAMYSFDEEDQIVEHNRDCVLKPNGELSATDLWLWDNLVAAPGSRIHCHRFDRAYSVWLGNQDPKTRPKPLPRTGFSDHLYRLGYKVSFGNEKCRDADCCKAVTRYVLDVEVKVWPPL